jgi:hypothetical protein
MEGDICEYLADAMGKGMNINNPSLFISYGCHKHTYIYSLTIQVSRRLKSRCQKG